MTKVCFLSMDSLDGYVSDDALAIPHIEAFGIGVETLSWRQTTTPWNDFAAVIIRTPWDYQKHPQQFLAVLAAIEKQTALYNPLEIVRWNLTKTYLRDLESKGVRIVPTLWNEKYDAGSFERWCSELSCDEVIIKPTVSATAEHTHRLADFDASLTQIFKEREFLVQPFLDAVVTEGEYSLFYFNGEYSHAIVKEPKPEDFRVQEEHGGIITEIAADGELRAIAECVLSKIGPRLLYARVDLIRDNSGRFALMELELIEPSLYLRMNADAPARFARAVADILSH
jgi:glutathione synthase/RimK-type ligase-like ATP-grasp enzyme